MKRTAFFAFAGIVGGVAMAYPERPGVVAACLAILAISAAAGLRWRRYLLGDDERRDD